MLQQTCSQCGTVFTIRDEDLAFYTKMSPVIRGQTFPLPPPKNCPTCRLRQRLNWRPELHLFKRKCDRTGKSILSFFPPGAPATVWSTEEWWKDDWDPKSYGCSFDPARPFMEQFSHLLRVTPMVAISVGGENINSAFVNSVSWVKNCYLIAGANRDEDCMYGIFINDCNQCVDNCFIDHCELCYECVDCSYCYDCRYSQQCTNCSACSFCFGCRGSQNCFGSVNLANRQFVWKNEQLSEDAYRAKLANVDLKRQSVVLSVQTECETRRLSYPHRYMVGEMNENVSGNSISRSRTLHECFDCSEDEDCAYCTWFHRAKTCYDCYSWGYSAEECYQCLEVGDASHRVHFSFCTYRGEDVWYSVNCRGCSHIFGCVSLRNAQYCILNKQYTKEEYEIILPTIIERMQHDGSWGEFFPYSICPFAYNQSIAIDYFPILHEEARVLHAHWNDMPTPPQPAEKVSIPDSIALTPRSICDQILTCVTSHRPYKNVPQEYAFYVRLGIPLPLQSFWERHMARLRKRNPRILFDRPCDKCGKGMRTTYAPSRPEVVYCEECYRREVY